MLASELSLYQSLDRALHDTAYLWRPQPFVDNSPAWLDQHPDLQVALMALPDEAVDRLNNLPGEATSWLRSQLPELAALPFLEQAQASVPVVTALPDIPHLPLGWAWEIPGKKQAQIMALAQAVSEVQGPLLDWCGGKGHLGRLLALLHHQSVTTLEWDPALSQAGEALALKQPIEHNFCCRDALTVKASEINAQHAIGLHACGELHRHLLRLAVEAGVKRLDIVPCCYHKGVEGVYQPFSTWQKLTLSAADVRLAVTETVTASVAQRRHQQSMRAWKLGFDAWRREGLKLPYRPFKPIPSALARTNFQTVLKVLCDRESLPMPSSLAYWEARGRQREREVARFSIVRHAFRRAIELWLISDMACFLDAAGYQVGVRQFCTPTLTPRNLWLSAC